MKIIAHRANIGGPNLNKENSINNILKCIDSNFDVEIDIRVIKKKIYLGHDKPEKCISINQLLEIKKRTWIHCKNLEALSFFSKSYKDFNFFWHENDAYTLTSKGYIWAYPGSELSPSSICVMPEIEIPINNLIKLKELQISGICTDYPDLIK